VISQIGGIYEDIEGMKALVKASAEAGADAVKLQTYKAETIALPGAEFEFEDGSRMSQYEFFKRYEISDADHKALFDCARECGITIFSTPSHQEDADLLESLGAPAFKTGSDDLTNTPFLAYLAKKGKPMIVSTGMATLQEVEEALEAIRSTGNDQVILLHCTVSYPPNPEFANLRVIETMRQAFDVAVGYSDHIVGVYASVLAAQAGACVVEKHLTLDRALGRPDSQVALEPTELAEMVRLIRLTPVHMGSGVKRVLEPEQKWRQNARKSLVAARDMNKGEVLAASDIKIMRPGTGIHPRHLPLVIGRTLSRGVGAGTTLGQEDFSSAHVPFGDHPSGQARLHPPPGKALKPH
jgi:sialic acid synthase SpsE